MSSAGEFGNPLRKFKLVFLGEQSGEWPFAMNPHSQLYENILSSGFYLFRIFKWYLKRKYIDFGDI